VIRFARNGLKSLIRTLDTLGVNEGGAPFQLHEGVMVVTPLETTDRYCMGSISVTGVATFQTQAQLFNVAASEVDLYVDFINVGQKEVTGEMTMRRAVTQLSQSAGTEVFLDRDIPGAPRGEITGAADAASSGTVMSFFNVEAGVRPWTLPGCDRIILTPGTGVHLATSSADQNLAVTFGWHERQRFKT